MGSLIKKDTPDRSKINVHQPHEVHCWTKHLDVSKEDLQKAVDKAAGQKEGARAVSVTPDKKDGRPVAAVGVLSGGQLKSFSAPLD